MMFEKVLIANRGEIACRIIRAAKSLGIKTVAVYSDADRYAEHVKFADEAFCLGASDVHSSYLNNKKIIAIAHESKVQAIHPGYGFLSENPDFARSCEMEGFCFIGPSSQTIAKLADKAHAKALAASLLIPVIQSIEVPKIITDAWVNALDLQATWIIKACAGGGGKGMRLIEKNDKDIQITLELAKKESKKYFNDDAIFLERYIKPARHIEVQILADQYGKVLHLFDRDCSLQRRFQKVIEEAPAPDLNQDVRENMYKAAILLAQSVGYVNAGTVEFLLDDNQNFYFLEMNTRLQVEHCVTEMITHQDIVQKQFQIAAGLPIVEEQSDFKIDGVAIEVRLCAEMPEKNFMPSVGLIKNLKWPNQPSIRIDSGYEKGSLVTPYYDSMLAKIIAHGKNREDAVHRLQDAMNSLTIEGIQTNQDWILNIIHEEVFSTDRLSTHFLDQYQASQKNDFPRWLAPALMMIYQRFTISTEQKNNPWYQNAGISNATRPVFGAIDLLNNDAKSPISLRIIEKDGMVFEVFHHLEMLGVVPVDVVSLNCLSFFWNNHSIKAYLNDGRHHLSVRMLGDAFYFKTYLIQDKSYAAKSEEHHFGELHAKLPGSVVKVMIQEGAQVQKGDRLLVIEAMKMEHAMLAPFNGVVQKIFVEEGDLVSLRQLLVVLKHGCA